MHVLITRIKLAPSDGVGIYLPAPVFSHGQLYIAFLRGKSFDDIFVSVCGTKTQHRENETKNM